MFIDLFLGLKNAGLPVSLREYLTLLEAMEANVAAHDIDDFYYLSRATLVKDERFVDRFDRVFGEAFKGLEKREGGEAIDAVIPEEWLRVLAEKHLSEEEKAEIEALGGFDALMETLKKRLEEQQKRHQGGSKWIGTGGTSPFGSGGYNPEGIRIGGESRHRRAVKVWEKRAFKNYDGDIEIGVRNIKMALRRLRRFARDGAEVELDLDDTVRSTAGNGGMLDIRMAPERRNAIKVLLFFDVGGSMDDHIRVCEELFSAARVEFKNLEYFYFHNCVYESVWRDNRRRFDERLSTDEVIRTYGPDYKVIFVGDATMSPYEVVYPGGSVEHWNEEPGKIWMERLLNHFKSAVWLNPQPAAWWDRTASIRLLNEIVEGRMFPLTLGGLDTAMKELS